MRRNDYRPETDASSSSELDIVERLLSDRLIATILFLFALAVVGSSFMPEPEPIPDCQVIILPTPTPGEEGGRLLREIDQIDKSEIVIVSEKWYNEESENASDFGETRRSQKGLYSNDAISTSDFIMAALSSQEGGDMRRYIANSRRTKPIPEPELSADFTVVSARVWDYGRLRLYWDRGGFTVRERGGSGYWFIPHCEEAELLEALEPILAELREETT